MHHHRLQCLILFLFCTLILGTTDRPNIVFIVADDLGWNDVGFNGGDVHTPNLDALAGQGIVISRYYTQPCCSPSRTALMTARYPIRSGMQSKPLPAGVPLSLPLSEKIFPQYFHELGYRTHLIGKWHLGYQTTAHLPTRRGFDSFFGYLNGYLSYYDATHTQSNISGFDLRRNDEGAALESYGKYLTDLLTEEAVSVIKSHPDYGGLLLFLMHAAPHTGNLPFFREAPPNVPGDASGRQVLREMVRGLDKSVGEVVEALNKNGMLNNTIIVFISDNGAPTVDELYHYENYGSNWPLRGEKLSNREGGVRTPSFIWSPQFREQPRVSKQLFHVTDWLPTLYSAAGGNGSQLSGLDGVDQWTSLFSSASTPRTELLVDIDEIENSESYILNHWKLVKDPAPEGETAFTGKYYGESGTEYAYDEEGVEQSYVGRILPGPKETYSSLRNKTFLGDRCKDKDTALQEDCYNKYCLYNILEDPTECYDLSGSYPSIVAQLKERLDKYRKVLVPRGKWTMDPKADPKYWGDYWSPWMDSTSSAISLISYSSFLPMYLYALIPNLLVKIILP